MPNITEDTVKAINSIVEFNEVHQFMDDESVDRALELVVKLIDDPGGVPPERISIIIVELQALSTKFAVLATYYSGIGKDGTNEVKKKNLYFTLRAAIDELVAALKYHQKAGQF
jgi:hypothetical protein